MTTPAERTLALIIQVENRLSAVEARVETMNLIKRAPKKKSGCEHYVAEKTNSDMDGQFKALQKEVRANKRKELNKKYRDEYKAFDQATKDDWTKRAETALPRERKAPAKK